MGDWAKSAENLAGGPHPFQRPGPSGRLDIDALPTGRAAAVAAMAAGAARRGARPVGAEAESAGRGGAGEALACTSIGSVLVAYRAGHRADSGEAASGGAAGEEGGEGVRFVVDSMLGRAAKWLRCLGVDSSLGAAGDREGLLRTAIQVVLEFCAEGAWMLLCVMPQRPILVLLRNL